MKKSLLAALFSMGFGLASVASAAMNASLTHNQFSFGVNGHEDLGTEVYYNCDSVESYTEDLLQKMGAQNISVTCMGDHMGLTSYPNIEVSFDSARTTGAASDRVIEADWTPVSLHDFNNCQLARAIVRGVQDHFEIKDLTGMRSCGSPGASYRYNMTVLMPK